MYLCVYFNMYIFPTFLIHTVNTKDLKTRLYIYKNITSQQLDRRLYSTRVDTVNHIIYNGRFIYKQNMFKMLSVTYTCTTEKMYILILYTCTAEKIYILILYTCT